MIRSKNWRGPNLVKEATKERFPDGIKKNL
jgi:hypothetical protein